MLRLLITLMVPCILCFTAALLLVHMQSYDGSTLGSLLVPPEDCGTLCFMGIKPGITTVDAALQQLQASPMIQLIRVDTFDRYDVQSIEAFVALPLERDELLFYAEKRIIQSIRLSGNNISLGDIVLLLGQPTQFALNDTLHTGFITYAAFYPQYNLIAAVDLPTCSWDLSAFWNARRFVSIGIETDDGYAEQTDYYLTGVYQSREGWAQQFQAMKQSICA